MSVNKKTTSPTIAEKVDRTAYDVYGVAADRCLFQAWKFCRFACSQYVS